MEKELYLRALQNRRRITKALFETKLFTFTDICEYFGDHAFITQLDLEYYHLNIEDFPSDSNEELFQNIMIKRDNYFKKLQDHNFSQQELDEKITEMGFTQIPKPQQKNMRNYPGEEYRLIFEEGYTFSKLMQEFSYTRQQLWIKLRKQGIYNNDNIKQLRSEGVLFKQNQLVEDYLNGTPTTQLCEQYNITKNKLTFILKANLENQDPFSLSLKKEETINLFLRGATIHEIEDSLDIIHNQVEKISKEFAQFRNNYVGKNELRQKQCFDLYFNEKYTQQEIANELNITRHTVRTDIRAYSEKHPELVPQSFFHFRHSGKEIRERHQQKLQDAKALRETNLSNVQVGKLIQRSGSHIGFYFLEMNDRSASPYYQNIQWNVYIRRQETIPKLLEGNSIQQVAKLYDLPIEDVKRDQEYLEKIQNGHFNNMIAIQERRQEVLAYATMGYTPLEIANLLNVDRSMIYRDLKILQSEFTPQIYENAIQEFTELSKSNKNDIEIEENELDDLEL